MFSARPVNGDTIGGMPCDLSWHKQEACLKSIDKALAVLSLAVLSGLCGCNWSHSRSEVYYLISVNTSAPYWQTVAAGFRRATGEYKVTARVVGPGGFDAQAELAELQKAVAAKPAGILISVANASLLGPGIDAAVDAGVPVITIDSDAPESRRYYFIGTNNLAAGQMGGKRLVQRLHGKGNVVFFVNEGQPNAVERLKGFEDVFANQPEMHVAEVIDTKGNAAVAFDKTREKLSLKGASRVDAFVCLNAPTGGRVADALRQANATDRVVVAWDVNQGTLDAIKAGLIDSTVTQRPYVMGYIGLKYLDQVFHQQAGAQFPAFVDTGTSLLDKSTVDSYLSSPGAVKKK